MASFQCMCQTLIDLSPIPNPHEWIVISAVDYCKWNEGGSKPLAIIAKSKVLLECPDYGRFWFF
jgi:hypothetical protein